MWLLLPTALCQHPQFISEGSMNGARRALPVNYRHNNGDNCTVFKWSCAGEYLDKRGKATNKILQAIANARRTSIMTIAKENTSAALLCVPFSFKISGAVHLAA